MERRCGTTPCNVWCDQPMDLDKASVDVPMIVASEGDEGEGVRAPYALAGLARSYEVTYGLHL